MLDVKNGKIAKINSSLTPEERDCFFGLVSEALNKLELKKEIDSNSEKNEVKDIEEDITEEEKEIRETEETNENEEKIDSRKVSAEKLIKEFSNFINSIS